jgi:hypothetical protein
VFQNFGNTEAQRTQRGFTRIAYEGIRLKGKERPKEPVQNS